MAAPLRRMHVGWHGVGSALGRPDNKVDACIQRNRIVKRVESRAPRKIVETILISIRLELLAHVTILRTVLVVVVVVCEVSTKHRAPSWPPTAADRRVL